MATAQFFDYWLRTLKGRFGDSKKFDIKTQELIKELFNIASQIKEQGDDNRKSFWITAPRGSFEEYCKKYDEEDFDVNTLKEWYKEQYPDEIKWYELTLINHEDIRDDKKQFYGIFMADEYVLSINDPNAKGWELDASEFLYALIERVNEVIVMLKDGIYNRYVEDNLPSKNKYGIISRKDYWDIYTEEREEFRKCFTDSQWNEFIKYSKDFKKEDEINFCPPNCIKNMTIRDYYETCYIGYKAMGFKFKVPWNYKEIELEKERYGGNTPKEWYYAFADGRDDGMVNLPLDDAYALDEWLEHKGPYYDSNGSHPWEVVSSASIRYSIHFCICSVKNSNKKYFALSGDAWPTCIDTMKFYLALKETNLPVKLHGANKIADRILERDYIGIAPETVPAYYLRYGSSIFDYKTVDHINLLNDENGKRIIGKAKWISQDLVELV